MNHFIEDLIKRYPNLDVCKNSIVQAFETLESCFANGHKLLIAGNGGSYADAEHIAGELMKSFIKKRVVSDSFKNRLVSIDEERGLELSTKLQQGLPTIVLGNHQGLNTAFINDVENGGLLLFAQQLFVYGQKDDVLLAISTSGNSTNVINACVVAKAKKMKTIGLTGQEGGLLKEYCDVVVKVPAEATHVIQEYHLPIYHCLCLMLEEVFFK